ncbi:nitronate monooxygenase [Cohnella rhizosphaerae]|uniref:nitronate monooxygenase n=1 Tax=Cohnella rhizosphaerae TaxID=1457232 RepID=UPI003B8A7B37
METSFTRKLGIAYPIVQAPMASGPATPELAAAVSNAGGLGSLGAGYWSPAQIRDAIREVRRKRDAVSTHSKSRASSSKGSAAARLFS